VSKILAYKPNWRSMVLRFILLTVGGLVSAFGVIVFLVPSNIAPGGVSGVGVILNHLIGVPIGLFVLLGNIPIQYLGYRILGGWRVTTGTLYYIVVYSVALDFLTPFLSTDNISDNTLLMALFGGIVTGIGGGLVYRAGATGGGTSTLARIVQMKFGLPLSTISLYTDGLVITAAGLVFGWEAALFAIITLFVGSATSDYVLEGPSVIRTATIVTDYPDDVSQAVFAHLHRGVTAWQGEGMFTEKPHTVLFITISRPQVNLLREIVFAVDPRAFIVIGQGHVAYGEGFKTQNHLQKTHKLPPAEISTTP